MVYIKKYITKIGDQANDVYVCQWCIGFISIKTFSQYYS